MQTHTKKGIKIAVIILSAVVILLTVLGLWLYTGKLTNAKIKTFSLLPFPMAFVNGRPIPISEFIFRYNNGKKNSSGQNDDEIRNHVAAELITEEKTRLLAAQKDVLPNAKQVDDEYLWRATQSNLEGKTTFSDLLNSFGFSPGNYKNSVIVPELNEVNLQTWFNSQPDLNQEVYSEANSLLAQIQNGADFGALAASSTQDLPGKSVKGDLGFVDVTTLLPEMREAVANMKTGEVKIIPSRYGLHIIKLEEKNDNQLHLRQIFMRGGDFQTWYNNETKNYTVHQLIKI